MPKLFKLSGHDIVEDRANAPFVNLADEDAAPTAGGVIVSLARFRSEGASLAEGERPVGVRLPPEEAIEGIADDGAMVAAAAPAAGLCMGDATAMAPTWASRADW